VYEDAIRREFKHQVDSFSQSGVMTGAEALGTLLELVPEDEGGRWLEVACGPGAISRALAPRVGTVHGVDLTPAMVEAARREAAAAGLSNVTFAAGDATALELDDDSFDGAVTRFSLHHIPRPGRVLGELARVVRPGGAVVVADHVTDPDADLAAWHQEIERLRDPSHWASLSAERMRALGTEAGLRLEREELVPFTLDFDDWLARGSGGASARELIEESLRERPAGAPSFRVVSREGERLLELRYWVSRWRTSGRASGE
jgi:SAM-dependent methyltransferase